MFCLHAGPDLAPAQLALIEAAKKAGTIKRFIPSEFGGDYDLADEGIAPALRGFLGAKQVGFAHQPTASCARFCPIG